MSPSEEAVSVFENLSYKSFFTLVEDLVLQKTVVFTSRSPYKLSAAVEGADQVILKALGLKWLDVHASFLPLETDALGSKVSASSWASKLILSPFPALVAVDAAQSESLIELLEDLQRKRKMVHQLRISIVDLDSGDIFSLDGSSESPVSILCGDIVHTTELDVLWAQDYAADSVQELHRVLEQLRLALLEGILYNSKTLRELKTGRRRGGPSRVSRSSFSLAKQEILGALRKAKASTDAQSLNFVEMLFESRMI